jgi:hypothetical protein
MIIKNRVIRISMEKALETDADCLKYYKTEYLYLYSNDG